jgi:acetylglutamate kinase
VVTERPVVIKIGGRACETVEAQRRLAIEIASLSAPLVLVHGGGAELSGWCERLGIAPRFEDGLRVTDAATLEVATAVLAGLANKRWVATLRAAGVDAIGLAALDGGMCDVVAHPDAARLGDVGAVEAVQLRLLDTLLGKGSVPVLASIGALDGRLLNLNADDLAAAVASALGARLVLLTDTPGLTLDGALVPWLDRAGLDRALAHPDVRGGMVAKLVAARAALDGGAPRVVIAAWTGTHSLTALVDGVGGGTQIVNAGAAPDASRISESVGALHG